MTENQWIGQFKRQLSPLPAKEREQAAAYYRELFADRKEAGAEEEAVAAELGSPQEAAQRPLRPPERSAACC